MPEPVTLKVSVQKFGVWVAVGVGELVGVGVGPLVGVGVGAAVGVGNGVGLGEGVDVGVGVGARATISSTITSRWKSASTADPLRYNS